MGCCISSDNTESQLQKFSTNFVISPGDFVRINTAPIQHHYKFQKLLGSGSFAEVHQALHIQTNSIRAIKSLSLANSEEALIEKLLKEVSVLKLLDHPNIIKIYEVFRNKAMLFIVTEYCSGGELFDKIKELGRFSENQAAKYCLDIVSAVMHCHQQGIVHRDLKPENLLFESLQEGAKLKLIDFGTSQFFDKNKKMKKLIGTYYYIAPEVLEGEYDQKCDVWSIGVILYVMLCGRAPFGGSTDEEIVSKIKNAPLSFLHPNWQGISSEAKMLITKMIKKPPIARASIEQVYNDIWLQSRGNNKVPDIVLQSNTLISLSKFKIESRLQKAIYYYIVTQMLDREHFSKLREVFLEIDTNGDGFLSVEELKQAVERLELSFDVDEILKQCDSDKNGLINYSEFLTATVNRKQAFSRERLKEVFMIFDRNHDGKLSMKEIKSALGENSQSESIVKKIIEEADINGDGEIDLEEFINHMTKFQEGY